MTPASTISGSARSRVIAAVATIVAAVAFFSAASPAQAADPAWQSADQITTSLFNAQTDLILNDPSGGSVEEAKKALSGPLRRGFEASSPAALKVVEEQLDRANRAVASGDSVALAAARGTITAALRRGAFDRVIDLTAADRPEAAREWLQIRDFRQSTRYTRVGTEATDALIALEDGDLGPDDAVLQVRKDLLDTYQSRLGTNLEEADKAAERRFPERLAESAAITAGYWQILTGEYEDQRGPEAATRANLIFENLAGDAAAGDTAAVRRAVRQATRELEGFVAAPLTEEEKARRASQFSRFIDLVPVEYGRGVADGKVTKAFEIQEAVAFAEGASQALKDLSSDLLEQDPAGTRSLIRDLGLLQADLQTAAEGGAVKEAGEIEQMAGDIAERAEGMFPDEWKASSDDADYDLVNISLDQMLNAINAGEYEIAEQNRLSAYAFFEFGPEIKLQGFDPGLSLEIEGMFWYGARDLPGLATLIADQASGRETMPTLVELRSAIDEAHEITGSDASPGTAITNAALIVFREGLEAILIIAAITASMIGARQVLRKPVYRGALLAIPASVISYLLMVLLLGSFAKYGEKVEAVVGVMAIGVLLVVLNWFFHKVYWTEWIASHRKRTKEVTTAIAAGSATGAATVFGLYAVGFEAVFREGMETVLFLQALQLAAGTGAVAIGVAIGLAAMGVVGFLTFKLESRLPYKKMLIVTGVLIALVLFTMVGQTVRTLQGVGWFPIHPIDIDIPLWMGTWLGIYPSVETLVAQILSVVFVIGSYWAAGWYSKRKMRIQREQYEAEQAALKAENPSGENGRNGAEPHDDAVSVSQERTRETV
ncbi:MAG: FTR1 family protein [Solirubrobacterales bacterium]|nr:FTR1 family protein [Solirubrobacterales bacterium]